MILENNGHGSASFSATEAILNNLRAHPENELSYTVDFNSELLRNQNQDLVITTWIYLIWHNAIQIFSLTTTERFVVIHPDSLPPDQDIAALVNLTFEHFCQDFEIKRQELKYLPQSIKDIPADTIPLFVQDLKSTLQKLIEPTSE